MTRRPVLILIVLIATAGSATARIPVPVDLAALLDRYASGKFEEAVRLVEEAGDAQAQPLRQQWKTAGVAWIDADKTDRPRRLLAVAAFVLETERVRAERGDWNVSSVGLCVVDPKHPERALTLPAVCFVEWAQSLFVERGAPDDAERTWVLAAAALAGGVRDWRLMYRTGPGSPPQVHGLIAEALSRFPDHPQLRLERAIATSARYNVTTDGGALPPGPITIVSGMRGGQADAFRGRIDPRAAVIDDLTSLTEDKEVGAEARLRLGYLLWALGDQDRARIQLKGAAAAARDADLKYLARFLLGWTAMTAGRAAEAIPEFEAALSVRPDSQSAALALASLELQRGEAGRAHEISRSSLHKRPTDDDPWRLFLYGHYPRLPALMAELRRKVHP